MFKVECLGCQAPYQVDERRVPDKGLKMRCPKCGTTFKVEPPAQGAAASQATLPEPETPRTAAPAPFTSGNLDPTSKLGKPPTPRDSLARTMIGVSSAEMDQLSKEAPGAKPKTFRIPRPDAAAPESPAPRAPTAQASGAPDSSELDLPAGPARRQSLGLALGSAHDDAALPELVRSVKGSAPPALGEVQRVMPSAAPGQDAGWMSPANESDGVVDSGEAGRLHLSDLPRPVAAPRASDAPRHAAPAAPIPPLELDLQDDLPIVASAQKRPPPRRHRAPPVAAPSVEDAADLPARPQDVEIDLPAIVAPLPPPRGVDRGQPPAAKQKRSAFDELDLPATAPRELSPAGLPVARAPMPEAAPVARQAAGSSLDLPSAARARPSPRGLGDADLPAVGRAEPAGNLPAAFRAATKVDLAAAQRAQDSVDLPSSVRTPPAASKARPAAVPSDLPDVLGAGAPPEPRAPALDVIALPDVLTTGLPDVLSPALPSPPRGHADLPDVLGDPFEAAPSSWRADAEAGLPLVSDSGLPDVLGGYSQASAAGLPALHAAGLPQLADAGLPDVLGAGLPEVHGTGLPDVLASGLPEVHGTGLPDVLSSGLPVVSPAALPQVRAAGISGFGRVDLPLPREAELPTTRGRIGFDEVDLPGVGESLPSLAEHWGSANLPAIGETLPTAKGQHGGAFDGEGTPFDAFGDAADGDPFAGSEADFGATDADDPFAPPDVPRAGEPPAGAADDDAVPDAPAPGSGYGEVDIGAGDPSGSLETADDMEFQAIPQRNSAPPARAAASASVHAESADMEAAGSTLELGPERKAPKVRTRRMVAAVAVALGMVAGGALALKPAIGPFGIHFVMDTIKRGEHERLLGKLVAEARAAAAEDVWSAMQGPLGALEKARKDAPRFGPLSARSAFEHYAAALRFGPLPNLEASAKVALDQVDADADHLPARLARAAQAAVARTGDAKRELQALATDPDAGALLGELSLRDKDWAGAARIWGELAKREPKSARAAFGVARAELGSGQLSEASARAREVLSLQPAHVGARVLLLEAERAGRAGSDANADTPGATEQLVSAVNLALPNASPGEAALAHCVLGELHASQGRAGPAQQEFEAALVLDRALPRALIGLGEVLHQAGRDTEALARFDAAAQAEPRNLQAQIGIAKTHIQLAHLPEAKAVLARLDESHKQHPAVIFWSGKSEQALGNNDAALAAYRASINASQGKDGAVEAYLALAKLQADLGQLAAAQDTLNEARGKLPANGPLFKALGEIALSRADYSSAYEHFQKALGHDSGDTRARFLGAVALTRLGRFEEALTAFQSVGATDKDFPGLAVERGRLFEESGRNAEALAEFEAALKKTPDDPEVQIRVGCSRVVAGRAAEAQQLLDLAAKARPRSPEVQFCLGRALFDQERFTDAMMRLERAVSLDPTRAVYHQFRGWVAIEMGRQGEAEQALDEALELDKGLADAYWLRGRLRLKQGAARDAIVDLERARQLKPTRYDAIADLAVAYADTGRLQKALDSWEEAIAKDADNPTWHFRYGKLLSASGNGQMAAAHLRRALDLVAEAGQTSALGGAPSKPQPWLWQAHYLLARELGVVPASIPHWQAYLRLSARDDPYRPEAERALRALGQPWMQR